MAVANIRSITLEVPAIGPGVRFYQDAGLVAQVEGNIAQLSCEGQSYPSIVLLGGYARKRLNHIQLCADRLDDIAAAVPRAGGRIVQPPETDPTDGLWVRDPHGMMIHLVEAVAEVVSPALEPYQINAPGRIVRIRRSAMAPVASCQPVRPLRLGHVLLFTPDVLASVDFMTTAFGMGLADRAQDVIAFTCARQQSDHHVVAFAKSPDIGFHHASFQVADPDEVGRAGCALRQLSGRGDWGFGRHTIGSNFFHYIQDPWGSWFEYYADMDYIDDYDLWTPTNYTMADSLANWGPDVPDDFVHNYEVDLAGFAAVPHESLGA